MAPFKDKKPESFTIDSMVEVSREEDEGFNKKRAWYVAKLLKKSLPNQKPNKFLVQYKTLFSPNKQLLTEEIIGVSFIRPLPPPPAADQIYDVYDVVDAFHRGGWWRGVVSKVEIFEAEKGESRRYSVIFEYPPEKFDFCSENLRFRSVWINGNWVRSPNQERMRGLNFGKGMAVEVNLNGEIWFPAIVLEEVGFNSFLVEHSRSSKDGPIKETIDSFQIRPPPPKFEVKEFEILQHVEAFHDSCWKKGIIKKALTGGRYKVILDSVKHEVFSHSEIRPPRIWRNGKWVAFKNSSVGEDRCREKSCRKKMSDEIDDTYEKSSVKKFRKDPLAIQEDNNDAIGQQHKVSQGTETEACASEKDTENGGVTVKTLPIVPVDVREANHALSTFCLGSDQSPTIIAQEDGELAISQEMPFEKSSSFWKLLDSLDIFQFLPQKPHFSPLSELNESTREGFAIAHMLNFANVVEKTSKLQVETPREVIDSYLEALSNLQVFGFDVKAVMERINRLLSIKTRQEQIYSESKDIHGKIAQCDGEKAKMEEEIDAIVKMISELKERETVKLSEKVKKDYEMNILQIDSHGKRAEISNMKLDFERQIAAPW